MFSSSFTRRLAALEREARSRHRRESSKARKAAKQSKSFQKWNETTQPSPRYAD